MEKKNILSPMILLFISSTLFACTPSPMFIFHPFSRYKSEDGVLILDCQVSDEYGFGKLKLGDKYENVSWGNDWNGYLLTIRLESQEGIQFEIDLIDLGNGVYSKDAISVGKGKTSDKDERLHALTNWSSRISKERDLTDEEIDARYFRDAFLRNAKLAIRFTFYEIGLFKTRKYSLTLNEDKSFLLEQPGYSGMSNGTYSATKESLYLTFEKDVFFGSEGKTITFDVKKV